MGFWVSMLPEDCQHSPLLAAGLRTDTYLERPYLRDQAPPSLLHGALTPLFAWICLLVTVALIEGGRLFEFREIRTQLLLPGTEVMCLCRGGSGVRTGSAVQAGAGEVPRRED